MRKKIIALLLAALTVFSAGCTASAPSSADESAPVITAKSKEKRKIIIDTDTAGDDAVAMIIAAKTENVDILGVTVSAGNVELEQAVNNALMTLEIAGCDATVMTEDNEAYGQVILYQEGFGYDNGVEYDDYNFSVASKTADQSFKKTLIELLKDK